MYNTPPQFLFNELEGLKSLALILFTSRAGNSVNLELLAKAI